MDIGYPWDLIEANKMVVERLSKELGDEFWKNDGTIEENVQIRGRVKVGKGSVLKSGTYIEGDVVIGESCDVGPNAYIRGTTSLGNGCKVGGAAEVKNSIVMNGSKIPHHNYVGDSVIGEGCNLGSGTKVANLRLDDSHISVIIDDKRIDTGRRKLGVIMGDNVKTGINSVIDVGTVIGSDSSIGPSAKAYGHIAQGTKIM
jgi:bifunctional UDP-N-acetylglucosamine pyrophosphorylase/glucosamine-1-phosphate N-acetyltransferase